MSNIIKSILLIPRLVIGLGLFLLPGFLVTVILFTILFPDTLSISHLVDRSWQLMSNLELLVFYGFLFAFSYFIYKHTQWNKLIDTITPPHLYDSIEKE